MLLCVGGDVNLANDSLECEENTLQKGTETHAGVSN